MTVSLKILLRMHVDLEAAVVACVVQAAADECIVEDSVAEMHVDADAAADACVVQAAALR